MKGPLPAREARECRSGNHLSETARSGGVEAVVTRSYRPDAVEVTCQGPDSLGDRILTARTSPGPRKSRRITAGRSMTTDLRSGWLRRRSGSGSHICLPINGSERLAHLAVLTQNCLHYSLEVSFWIFAINASDKQQLLPCLVVHKTDVPARLHESNQPNASFPNLIRPPIFALGYFDFRM